MDAQQALERLQAGNLRFQQDQCDQGRRYSSDRRGLVDGQQPFAVILGCADSRVPPEIAFDTGLGELFVVRVAGNVANKSSVASIEYAVARLQTKLIVVLAHMSCGAVQAALAGGDAGENLNRLMEQIQPALAHTQGDVNQAARNNARLTASRLTENSDILRAAVQNDGVRIVTAFYDLKTGAIQFDV